jgi:hypothetical protein
MATGGVQIERSNLAAGIAREANVTQRESTARAAPEDLNHVAFEALVIDAARRDKSTASRSLRQRVADFVEPRISDPTPFLGGQSLSILERLASEILPGLDESEELRSLTSDIIADEIDRHRELLMRLQSDIAL